MRNIFRIMAAKLARAAGAGEPKLGRLRIHPPRALRVPERYRVEGARARARVAIVTPSYQQGPYIRATVDSVLSQSHKEIDYIVMDGGSTDGTHAVLESYGPRLTFVSEPDEGQTAAVNAGFARVEGDVMAYLNSDDILLPGAVAYVAAYFDANPAVDCVYGHRILIDETGAEIGRWVLPAHDDDVLRWADFVPQETLFWRRRIWDRVGGLDARFGFAMDWDLLLRFRAAGARIVRLPRFLGAFRVHESQKTSAQYANLGQAEVDLLRRREFGRVPAPEEIHAAISGYLRRHVTADLLYRWGLLQH